MSGRKQSLFNSYFEGSKQAVKNAQTKRAIIRNREKTDKVEKIVQTKAQEKQEIISSIFLPEIMYELKNINGKNVPVNTKNYFGLTKKSSVKAYQCSKERIFVMLKKGRYIFEFKLI